MDKMIPIDFTWNNSLSQDMFPFVSLSKLLTCFAPNNKIEFGAIDWASSGPN